MSDINSDFLSAPVEPEVATYLHKRGRRLGMPVSGNFELTPRCNFNCRMCYIHTENSAQGEKELTAAEWLMAGKQATEAGMVFLLLTGGEPLIRADFPEIYLGLKKLGLMISVNTNGSLLKGDLLKLFKEEPPSRLNISLYGASDRTYENLCRNSLFSQVMQNIENAVTSGLQVKLNYSITPYNCDDMTQLYEIAKKLNVPVQATAYMYPPLRSEKAVFGENSGRFSPEDAAFYRVKAEKLLLGDKCFLEKANHLKKSADQSASESFRSDCISHCRAGRSNFWIDWRGNMSMCGMIPANDNNILKKGFSDCWQEVRRSTEAIRLPEKCVNCEHAAVCSVCAAVCMCETGKFYEAPEYMCRFSQVSHELILGSVPSRTER